MRGSFAALAVRPLALGTPGETPSRRVSSLL
jgi:hypothetical protein